jgi:hypothetical protein
MCGGARLACGVRVAVHVAHEEVSQLPISRLQHGGHGVLRLEADVRHVGLRRDEGVQVRGVDRDHLPACGQGVCAQ